MVSWKDLLSEEPRWDLVAHVKSFSSRFEEEGGEEEEGKLEEGVGDEWRGGGGGGGGGGWRGRDEKGRWV